LIENKNFILKTTLFYTFIFLIIGGFIGYFNLNLEIKSYQNEQKNKLVDNSQKIQRAIYDFSNSKSDRFIMPKSFQYNIELKDNFHKNIYQTKNSNIKEDDKVVTIELELAQNRLEVRYLKISKIISYDRLYLKFLMLAIYMSLFIFTAVFLIIKSSIYPYKRANKFLDAFFDDAMHELKTPLGIIQLNLEILQENQPDTKEINRSINGVKNLLLVYQDIEYLIKYKSVKFTKENVDFSIFLQQRLEQFESLTHPKQLSFEISIEENISIMINRTQLQRILDNTLSNSIKYSNPKTNIVVTLHNEDGDIVYKVQNFGEIINDSKSIFNRYYKENTIKGGFGIGLNIVKNICELNNIKIEVNSTKKEGNVFKFIFLKNA
jgi:signal transduction histidine kinase